MEHKSSNLCDFCFTPIGDGDVCLGCGLSYETYKLNAGHLKPGTTLLDKYIIGRVLGYGGFGVTYLAYSIKDNKIVAIKEYFPREVVCRNKENNRVSIIAEDKRKVFEEGAQKFYEETEIMNMLNSYTNFASFYELFNANDTVYYVMEYMKGTDLKSYIKKNGGSISEDKAIMIMKCICEALKCVHNNGIIHRDISPDNIFICDNGEVKIIDFGTSKYIDNFENDESSVMLKTDFAPVELYSNNGEQGTWTDVYALGATIYYALSGKPPENAINRAENPNKILEIDLNISSKFAKIIVKCLRYNFEQRYQDAEEVLDAIYDAKLQEIPIVVKTNSKTSNIIYRQQGPPQHGQSQYHIQQSDTSNILKWIILGASAFVVIVLLVVLITMLAMS